MIMVLNGFTADWTAYYMIKVLKHILGAHIYIWVQVWQILTF